MKQKDILTLVVVAIVAAVLSFVLSSMFFSSPKNRSQKVETIDPISSDFTNPSKKYFNANSIDPAKLVEIKPSDIQNPFGS
jgi:hypothetical protein